MPSPSDVEPLREEARQVQFVKLKDMETYSIRTELICPMPHELLPNFVQESIANISDELGRPSNFAATMEYYSRMAEMTFAQWGNHVPMVFLLNSNWAPIDMLTPSLEDQVDKYFFWRLLAERIALQDVHALVYIAEVWIRDIRGRPTLAISELPIIGEKLRLCGLDRECNMAVHAWEINRVQDGTAALGPRDASTVADLHPFFLVPVMRSMGLEPDFLPKRDGQGS